MSASVSSTESLYSDHHNWLRGWLHRKLGNACDAADLAHDTFMRLIVSRRDALGDEPRALLTHIAKGLVIDHWRRRDTEQAYLQAIAHLPEAEVPSPETQMLIIESLMRIDAMLRGLPAQTVRVFLLCQLEGLTLEQISKESGMPVITVRRHIRKSLIACMAAA